MLSNSATTFSRNDLNFLAIFMKKERQFAKALMVSVDNHGVPVLPSAVLFFFFHHKTNSVGIIIHFEDSQYSTGDSPYPVSHFM
jgi:hypothetical protein